MQGESHVERPSLILDCFWTYSVSHNARYKFRQHVHRHQRKICAGNLWICKADQGFGQSNKNVSASTVTSDNRTA
ncbi:hypothetical protein MHYP_G00202300 [Metynnis hypsauchen]